MKKQKKILSKIDEGVSKETISPIKPKGFEPLLPSVPSINTKQLNNNKDEEKNTNSAIVSGMEQDSFLVDKIEPKPIEVIPVEIPKTIEIPKSVQIMNLETKIATLKKELKSAPNGLVIYNFSEQSETLENIMDYRMDKSRNNNSSFEYKNFRYRQWRQMQGRATLEEPAVEKIKIN